MVGTVKPVCKGNAKDLIFFFRCRQVPFNTGTLILYPSDCKSVPYDRFYCFWNSFLFCLPKQTVIRTGTVPYAYVHRFYVLQNYAERKENESGGKEDSKRRSMGILINRRHKAETKEERMTYKQEY
jgi:hypothetical protein